MRRGETIVFGWNKFYSQVSNGNDDEKCWKVEIGAENFETALQSLSDNILYSLFNREEQTTWKFEI